jgi:hypothetical protein
MGFTANRIAHTGMQLEVLSSLHKLLFKVIIICIKIESRQFYSCFKTDIILCL